MAKQRVRELASQLAEELHRSGGSGKSGIDEESRRALDALRSEVDRALAQEKEPAAKPSDTARTLTERLERDHPELTALIQRLADALMAAGL